MGWEHEMVKLVAELVMGESPKVVVGNVEGEVEVVVKIWNVGGKMVGA